MCNRDELLFEFCAENLTHVERALAAGARRIELCDNLAVGGTSPCAGVVAQAPLTTRPFGASVRVMIRPRGGDFFYTEEELAMMEAEIFAAAQLGADGVVFGCLAPQDEGAYTASREAALRAGLLPGAGYTGSWRLDVDAAAELAYAARTSEPAHGTPLGITFHMAFDELDESAQLEAVDLLANLGVDRILTHGGPAGSPIEGNFERLRRLIAYADGRLTILPGGGITYQNARAVADALGARELHGTKIVNLSK